MPECTKVCFDNDRRNEQPLEKLKTDINLKRTDANYKGQNNAKMLRTFYRFMEQNTCKKKELLIKGENVFTIIPLI